MQSQTQDFGINQLSGLISLLVGFYFDKNANYNTDESNPTDDDLPKIGVKWAK